MLSRHTDLTSKLIKKNIQVKSSPKIWLQKLNPEKTDKFSTIFFFLHLYLHLSGESLVLKYYKHQGNFNNKKILS